MSNPSCRCCGRPLTDRASQLKGIGPDCERNPACRRAVPLPDDQFHDLPWEGDVVFERRGAARHFNIPRRHVDHSPAGWEWGYGGSGPADFALNILSHFEQHFPRHRASAGMAACWDGSYVHRDAYDLHLPFKRAFLEPIPQAKGGVIPGVQIIDWIDEHAPKGMSGLGDSDGAITDGNDREAARRQTQAGLFDVD